jgi:hypothetical protein
MNGIGCYEYNYDMEETRALMKKMNVSTIPTLVVYRVPVTNEPEDITGSAEVYRGDSKEIPETAMTIVNTFDVDEDF